ncbi:MAG: hypothetical protein ACYCOU_02855 [Sulfobacillus sp.]
MVLLDVVGNKVFNSDRKSGQTGGGAMNMIWGFVSLVALILAVLLSWRCNTVAGTGTLAKVLYAIVAGLFSYIYLIYYMIYRVFMAVPC